MRTTPSEKKSEELKKTWDYQLPKSESSTINWRSPAMSWKRSRDSINSLAVMPTRKLLSMKIRLDCWPKNLKDSTVLLKERTTKSEPWEVKFKELKKTWDFRLPKPPNCPKNLPNTRPNSKTTIKSHKPTVNASKNSFQKTTPWETKFVTLKKISDFPPHKSANSTTNWKLHATILKPFKSVFRKWATSTRRMLSTKTRSLYCHKSFKDWTMSLKGRIMKSEPWEVRFNPLRKISDCQPPKPTS